MYQLEHSMVLQMTRQMELMEFLESYRPCEFWETDAGSVTTGSMITLVVLIIAYGINKCFLHHWDKQNNSFISQIKQVIRRELRLGLVCHREEYVVEHPPSYDSVACHA